MLDANRTKTQLEQKSHRRRREADTSLGTDHRNISLTVKAAVQLKKMAKL
jgi:hypothetical protein